MVEYTPRGPNMSDVIFRAIGGYGLRGNSTPQIVYDYLEKLRQKDVSLEEDERWYLRTFERMAGLMRPSVQHFQ